MHSIIISLARFFCREIKRLIMKKLVLIVTAGMLLFSSCYTEVREGGPPRRHWGWRRRPAEKIIIRTQLNQQMENSCCPKKFML
jgi:hypothetical protein